ncbi:MAG: hypothetical protein HYY24_09915 [Verrucomicrobia bacterium]|nr:hypothetical protein [Verrucomicrobiota bacterium]
MSGDLQPALEHRERAWHFEREHRSGWLTVAFTEILAVKTRTQPLGDREGVALIQHPRLLPCELLRAFTVVEASTGGDRPSFVFNGPSGGVRPAIIPQRRRRDTGCTGLTEQVGFSTLLADEKG